MQDPRFGAISSDRHSHYLASAKRITRQVPTAAGERLRLSQVYVLALPMATIPIGVPIGGGGVKYTRSIVPARANSALGLCRRAAVAE